jgi:hypothetical protein
MMKVAENLSVNIPGLNVDIPVAVSPDVIFSGVID